MTDVQDVPEPTAAPEPWPQVWRIGFSVGVLFCAIVGIVLLNIWGDPANVIHTETVDWCFWLVVLVLFGGGVLMLAPAVLAAMPWGRK